MASLADMLRNFSDSVVNLPTEAQRFMVSPTSFIDALRGKTTLPAQAGFAQGATGTPQKENLTVLDPNNRAYMEGYSQGEPFSYAAMGVPALEMGATKLSNKAVQAITGNPKATASGVIDYASAYSPTSQIFIGPSSKGWSAENAFKAAKMEKAGKTPQEIWEATGTARGLDNNWRQEISDNLAIAYQKPEQMDLLNQYSQQMFGKRYGELPFGEKGLGDQRQKIVDLVNADLKQYDKIGTSLQHPELYKAYEDLPNIDLFQNKATSRSGEFNTNKGNPYIVSYAPNESELKSNLLHELQHGIQLKESWGLGGSPEEFLQPNKQKLNDIAKQLNEMALARKEATPEYLSLEQQFKKLTAENPPRTQDEAMEMYKKLGGEAEARLVQNRMNLTPEERALHFPFKQSPKGLDIDPMEAIIRLPDSKEMITRRQLLEGLINKAK